eukprot:gene24953-30148_t
MLRSDLLDSFDNLAEAFNSIHGVIRQYFTSVGNEDRRKDYEVIHRNLVNIFSSLVSAAANQDIQVHSLYKCMNNALQFVTSFYADGDKKDPASVHAEDFDPLCEMCISCLHNFIKHCKEDNVFPSPAIYINLNKLSYICSSLCMRSGEGLILPGVLPDEMCTSSTNQLLHAYIYTLKRQLQDREDGHFEYAEEKLSMLLRTHNVQNHTNDGVVCLLAEYFAVVCGNEPEVRKKQETEKISTYLQAIYNIFALLIDMHTDRAGAMHESIVALHNALTVFAQGEGSTSNVFSFIHMIVCAVLSVEWKTICAYLAHGEMHVMDTYKALFGFYHQDVSAHIHEHLFDFHAVCAFNKLLSLLQSYHSPYTYPTSERISLYTTSTFLSNSQWQSFCDYIQQSIHLFLTKSHDKTAISKEKFMEMYKECNDIINSLQTPPLLSHFDLYILKIYLALNVSKAMLSVYGDTLLALRHGRYCLSYTHKLHVGTSQPQTCVVLVRMLHVEALVSMVDVYDYLGKAHRVMQYIGEMEVVLGSLCHTYTPKTPTPVVKINSNSPTPSPYSYSSQLLNTVWSMYIHLRCFYIHMRLGSKACEQKMHALIKAFGCMCTGLSDVVHIICAGRDFFSDGKARSSSSGKAVNGFTINEQTLFYRNIPSSSSLLPFLHRAVPQLIPFFHTLRTSRRDVCIDTLVSKPVESFIHHAASMCTTLEVNAIHGMRAEEEDKEERNECITSVLGVYTKAVDGERDAVNVIHTALTTLARTSNLFIVSLSLHKNKLLIHILGDGICEGICLDENLGVGQGCLRMMEEYKKIIEESDATLIRQEDISLNGRDEDVNDGQEGKKGGKAGSKSGPKGKTATKAKGGMSEKEKKEWWTRREKTDQDLHDNLVNMQMLLQPLLDLLSKHTSVLSSSTSKDKDSDVDDVAQCIQDIHISNKQDDSLVSIYEEMKVTDLRTLSKNRGLSSIGRKQDIIERLLEQDKAKMKKEASSDNNTIAGGGNYHILFILDEHFTSYPLESLPFFRDRACSRLPSLLVLLGLLQKQGVVSSLSSSDKKAAKSIKNLQTSSPPLLNLPSPPLADITRCWYAVDIENNLPATRNTMVEYMQGYLQKWRWEGVVGSIPESEVVRSLASDKDVFIFSGHNAGDKLFIQTPSSSNVQFPTHRVCYLYGCSSVKMTRHGVYDPHGSVMHHLLAGTECIVGNLWDVTDKDLDKLSMACLDNSIQHTATSSCSPANTVVQALCGARGVCKMKYIVGSAAIVYGLPLYINGI